MENLIHKHSYARSPIRTYTGEEEGLGEDGHAHSRGELEVTPVMTSQVPSELCGSEALYFLVLSRFLPHSFVALVNLVSMVMCTRLIPLFLAASAFTASDNLSLSSWVTTTSGFSGFQHPQTLSAAMGTGAASLPHPIQGSLPPYSRLGMPLTPTALAGTMQGSGPSFPSFHMPRYHHYFQQGPYAAIQGLRHSSTVMTPFV